jgi:hypothetical protein
VDPVYSLAALEGGRIAVGHRSGVNRIRDTATGAVTAKPLSQHRGRVHRAVLASGCVAEPTAFSSARSTSGGR